MIIDAMQIYHSAIETIRLHVASLETHPHLLIVIPNDDANSTLYREQLIKDCEYTKISVSTINSKSLDKISTITKYTKYIDAILIQPSLSYKVPSKLIIDQIQRQFDPRIILDNCTNYQGYENSEYAWQKPIIPKAIISMIKCVQYHNKPADISTDLSGRSIAIINPSPLRGIPLMHEALVNGMLPKVMHSKIDMDKIIAESSTSDFVVSAANRPSSINGWYLKYHPAFNHIITYIDMGLHTNQSGHKGDFSTEFCHAIEDHSDYALVQAWPGILPVARILTLVAILERYHYARNDTNESCKWIQYANKIYTLG